MKNDIEIVSIADTHVVGVWRNVVIQIWEHPIESLVQRRAFQKTGEAFRTLRAKLGPSALLLAITVVSAHTNMPDAESRKIAAEFSSWFDYYVGVHEGTGFRASLVRTVVAGMALVAPKRAAHDICSDVRHGAAILAGRAGGTLTSADVVAAISELRARVAALRAA